MATKRWIGLEHPANLTLLHSLKPAKAGRRIIGPPSSARDPYMGCGSHPDVVERVWDQLGSELPLDCRYLLYRTPALIHPLSGVVLALAYGTEYCLRLPTGTLAEARG